MVNKKKKKKRCCKWHCFDFALDESNYCEEHDPIAKNLSLDAHKCIIDRKLEAKDE